MDYLARNGQRDEALQLAQEADRTFAALGDKAGQAKAIKNQADVLDDGGNHAAAIPVYQPKRGGCSFRLRGEVAHNVQDER